MAAVTRSPAAAAPASPAVQAAGPAVTAWQHPAVARSAAPPGRPAWYTVRPGDTLSAISARYFGRAGDWPRLYAANLRVVGGDPDLIVPGTRLKMELAAAGATGTGPGPATPAAAGATTAAAPAPAAASYSGGSAFQQCVIARESGGNAQIWNATGHWGLYQFAEGTWVAYGGSAASFGNASVAEQNQVFANAVAAGGAYNWTPYDGCTDAKITGPPPPRVTLDAFYLPAAPAVTLTAAQRHRAHLEHLAHLAWLAAHRHPAAVTGSGLAGRALAWAQTQAGKPYVWGGTGPGGYDCSGLVWAAYAHGAGVTLPRDTYEMLAAAGTLLIQVSNPQPGNLAFYGTGHVELYVRPGYTFGAQSPGTVVGLHHYGYGWVPTAWYRVA